MKNFRRTSRILIALAVLVGPTALYAQEPEVHWEMATWAPKKPGGGYQSQATSGEDWAYDVKLSYDGGSPDGYIFSGYSGFVNLQFTSGNYVCPDTNLVIGGCGRPKLFKTDPHGNLLWYEIYSRNEGELTAVIQTSDGGYLAVGRSRERGNQLKYRAPGTTITSLNCNNNCMRNVYVVKTLANGTVDWESLYGLATNPNSAQIDRHAHAWDVIEMPETDPVTGRKYRIVGEAPDPNVLRADGNFMTRAFILEIHENGDLNWIKPYGSTSGASTARGIARNGNTYAVVLNQFDKKDQFASPPAQADIVAITVGNGILPSRIDSAKITNTSAQHDYGFDIAYSSAGKILISGVVNCTASCFRSGGARGEGTATVWRRSTTLGAEYTRSLGTVKAFDLWVTLSPLSGGEVVVVSTKQPSGPHPGCQNPQGSVDCEWSGTDAYLAKLNSTLGVQWSRTYNAETSQIHKLYGDKHQECVYTVAPTPDGGYIVAGNNSSNWDDDYVLKFGGTTPQVVNNTTVDHSHIYYHGPDNLTIGPAFTVQNTAHVELVARSTINITGAFEAKLGSTFEASVNPSASFRPVDAGDELYDLDQEIAVVSPTQTERPEQTAFELYPNPFNPTTRIRFSLPETGPVSLAIYDIVGRLVIRLLDGEMASGTHEIQFDARHLPSGVYLYRLNSPSNVRSGAMMLVK